MAHSPTQPSDKIDDDYMAGWVAVFDMAREGRSWSGRERDCCFLNTGSLPFADVSAVSGLDAAVDGRGLAVTDWNRDGALDLWVTNRTGPRIRLLLNTKSNNHFLAIRLVGRSCNRDAIGARVELMTGGEAARTLSRTLHAGDAFLSQSTKWLHFGLGASTTIDRLTVRWPGGDTEVFLSLVPDRRYRIVQGLGQPTLEEEPGQIVRLTSSKSRSPAASDKARVALSVRIPMPGLTYVDARGSASALDHTPGRPRLINLWASWCPPCLAELAEFAEHAEELRKAGLDIIVLNVEDVADRSRAQSVLARLSWPFASGFAEPELLSVLDVLQRGVLQRHRPLPLPTSFLVDGNNQLSIIYKGPVRVAGLLSDLRKLSDGSADGHKSFTTRFEGQWYIKPESTSLAPFATEFLKQGLTGAANEYLNHIMARAASTGASFSGKAASRLARVHFRLGKALVDQGRFDTAIASFRRAIELDSGFWQAHNNLGSSLLAVGRPEEARRSLEETLRLNPNNANAHSNVGILLSKTDRQEDAIRHLRDAIRLEPDHARAHYALGVHLAKRNRVDEAVLHFRRARKAEPEFVNAHVYLGFLLRRKGEAAQAIEVYRTALESNPDDPQILFNLGLTYLAAHDPDGAMQQVATLRSVDPARARQLLAEIEKR